jgi:multisubunit Na+/H+ antiporter MnhB subunit
MSTLSPVARVRAVDIRRVVGLLALGAVHVTALGILLFTESDLAPQSAFLLTWVFVNCCWLVLLGRPLMAGALSLALGVTLIALSQFKHSVLMMTVTFVDVMLVNASTLSFLLHATPGLALKLALALVIAVALLTLLWRLEPFRVRRIRAAAAGACSLALLAGLSLAFSLDREDEFQQHQYVSKFARSAIIAAAELATHGILEADAFVSTRLNIATPPACPPARKLPHIVMVFDESSFDASMLPNVALPAGYRDRFRSADGRIRSLVVEGAGGPSWFTEYNVLAGLSVRSYGHFADSVTRLAAGRVKRGLPFALRNCGYSTYSLYSWFGAFAGARGFHTSTGIEHFLDAKQLRTGPADTDSFYYEKALRILAEQRDGRPAFVFVYLALNHFPWNFRYRPDLLTDWNLGNRFEIDEYLRRQEISAQDFAEFKRNLTRQFPGQPFLLVRFGDHQPLFAKHFLEPTLAPTEIAQRIERHDARYFTTYYAMDGLNFEPVELASALDPLDAPHLPVVVLEAAGVPLDAAFAEQKRILHRCRGLFYFCGNGAEARRFNRLLIDAGLIEGL